MSIIVHGDQLHVTHLSVAARDFPELLLAHRAAYPDTDAIEHEAQRLIAGDFEHNSTLAFVERVMTWGGGDRNAGRVLEQDEGVRSLVQAAYVRAIERGSCEGLVTLKPIKNLGIAFASKILRFLLPDSAVILDSVIRKKLGYEESPEGYQAFLDECRSLLDHVRDQPYPIQGGAWRICDIEAAIYAKLKGYRLVRP